MKFLAIIFLFALLNLVSSSQTFDKYSKVEENLLVEKIREKYKLINKNKNNYQQEESYWNYETDELPDSENENNEDGNEEITNIIYMDNAQKRLHTCNKHIYKYQVPYSKLNYYEGYFWDGELIFIYAKLVESLNGPDYGMLEYVTDLKEGTRATEKRIYIHNDNIFRVLRKDVQFVGEQDLESLLSNTPNENIDLDSLTNDDYYEEYYLFMNY